MKVTLDDFQRISDRTPFIADLKPSGKYVMEDVHKVGVVPRACRQRSCVWVRRQAVRL